MDITILIADKDSIYRSCLTILFKKETAMEVVDEAGDGKILFHKIRQFTPEIVITDINMPHLKDAEAVCELIAKFPRVKFIIFSTQRDIQFVLEMFKAEASGYLLKTCSFKEIKQAVNTVMENRIYLNADCLTGDNIIPQSFKSNFPIFSRLTDEERRVFKLISEGKSKKQIASILHINSRRVEICRRALKGKLNMHNVSLFTKYAIREGLIPV